MGNHVVRIFARRIDRITVRGGYHLRDGVFPGLIGQDVPIHRYDAVPNGFVFHRESLTVPHDELPIAAASLLFSYFGGNGIQLRILFHADHKGALLAIGHIGLLVVDGVIGMRVACRAKTHGPIAGFSSPIVLHTLRYGYGDETEDQYLVVLQDGTGE